jgi:hypothetical protein
MKKSVFALTIFIFSAFYANAQQAAKSAYVELGGAGLATVNYDMRFEKKEDGLGFKVGVGGFSIDGQSIFLAPIGINYLLGKGNKNYFEVGAGVTLVTTKDKYYNGNTTTTQRYSTTFGHAFFGYRLQPKNGGFLFRAGMTPIFNKDGFFPLWAGISFGYKF